MTIDYAKGLTFAFQDKDWLSKLGKAALWTFISMLLFFIPLYFFALGYGLDTARNIMKGKENPLPDLDDIGAIFKDGARFFVVTLVYGSPTFILYCIMFAVLISAGAFAGDIDEDALGAAMGGGVLAIQCLMYIFGFILAFLMPAIMTRYIQTDDIRESLNVGAVLATAREHFLPCLMILLMYFASSFIFGIAFMLSFITICGWIFVYFAGIPWLSAVLGHLVGQFANELDNPENKLDSVAF
ncbi:MAG: DUF4013 domain-containing protein [Chloroflexota bacterium]